MTMTENDGAVLLTITQAAKILGCSHQAVAERCDRGTLPCEHVPGGGRRIPANEVWPGRKEKPGRKKNSPTQPTTTTKKAKR